MSTQAEAIAKREGVWEVIPLKKFREKDDVQFSGMPMDRFPDGIQGVDHVEHHGPAQSPGKVNGVEGWYLHPHQQDNLLVLRGTRTSIIRALGPNKPVDVLRVSHNEIEMNGKVIHSGGPAILRWEKNVWHRVGSEADGSTSINFAIRYPGFDLAHEFDIHSLDELTGDNKVIRQGHEDQM